MAAPAQAAARWNLPQANPSATKTLQESLGIERLVAAVLVHRGYADPAAAREFLSSELTALEDPFKLRDMEPAVARIMQAIAAREPILLYGDYDVDGSSAIVVLKKAIEILGGAADFFIPHRLKDGYGMRHEIIERAAASGVRLIPAFALTMSCGTPTSAALTSLSRIIICPTRNCRQPSPCSIPIAPIAHIPTNIFAVRALPSNSCRPCWRAAYCRPQYKPRYWIRSLNPWPSPP